MELKRQIESAIDITIAAEVLRYTYVGIVPLEIVARVDLGNTEYPIAGGGVYVLDVLINGVTIAPTSAIAVPDGHIKTVLVGRSVPIEPEDVITIQVLGKSEDLAVYSKATLRDVTPIKTSDLTGGGVVPVDHNYGGYDELSVLTPDGVGIVGANILVYYATDYDANRRSAAYLVATGRTTVNGRWTSALLLSPGNYVLVMDKSPSYRAQAVRIAVN